MATFSEQLMTAREAAGATITALASRCAELVGGDAEVWRVTIGRYERRESEPSTATIAAVASALGLEWRLLPRSARILGPKAWRAAVGRRPPHGTRCAYCGLTKARTWDHVIPVSRGGPEDVENLVAACRLCNLRKHALLPGEWAAKTRRALFGGRFLTALEQAVLARCQVLPHVETRVGRPRLHASTRDKVIAAAGRRGWVTCRLEHGATIRELEAEGVLVESGVVVTTRMERGRNREVRWTRYVLAKGSR